MHIIPINLNFKFDEGDETTPVLITVPSGTSIYSVIAEIKNRHDHLCFDDPEDHYGAFGRDAETLMNYVCEKNHWEYHVIDDAIDLG